MPTVIPCNVWLDVSLQNQGSDRVTICSPLFIDEASELADYVSNGLINTNHYVTKIAHIDAEGNVTDLRIPKESALPEGGGLSDFIGKDENGDPLWKPLPIATTEKRGTSRIAKIEEVINRLTGNNGPAFLTPEHVDLIIAAIQSLSIGKMEFSPFRSGELPEHWYFMNGDRYLLSGPQGQALNGLPPNYKSDWGITVSGDTINVPKFFYVDGRGYFIRAVNGTNRQVGSTEDDAIINITGEWSQSAPGDKGLIRHNFGITTGAFKKGTSCSSMFGPDAFNVQSYSVAFDASLSPGVKTGIDNHPLSKGMTPAIYLVDAEKQITSLNI